MTPNACLVCGGAYGRSSLPGLLRCTSCAFVTADVSLSQEELEGLYTSRYFAGDEYMDYVSERRIIEKHFRIRLGKLLQYVEKPASKKLFEIGCAYGFFLSVARQHFASVEGIDISRDAVEYAAGTLGLKVSAGDFGDYQVADTPDVVCLWDTIEHIQSPHVYLDKLSRHMQPGGMIALTTGDIGSFVARWRGQRWRQIHPPTHLHYFSRATLTSLLERHGFRILYCGSDGMYRSLDTMAYMILVLRRERPALYHALKRTGILNWDLYVNLYDILFVVAEKHA
jgi:SAM-dependent methyltransferase